MSAVRRRLLQLGVGLATTGLLVGCGGDAADGDAGTDGADGGEASADLGSVTVGGPNFTEGQLMTEMYRLLLEDAGYTVTVTTVDARELYAPALQSGEIDVVPEYAATMAEFLNAQVNGPDAPSTDPVASSDAAATVEALNTLGEESGLVALEPAEAANQNGFVVTQDFAEAEGLTTLTELGDLGQPIVLAAVEECPERPFCQPGLEETYGLDITRIEPLGFGSLQTKQAVADGQADLGLVGTTDGTLESFGLVLLEDDQNLQQADNLVPVVSQDALTPELEEALNALAPVLTTEDLAEMNAAVDQERQKAADVAQAYLEEQGLLG
jgi:osmoprotectant transport system substrate-binding protein